MNGSESIGKLAAALVAAQAEIRGAKKDAKNPHFKNQYATLESVIDAVREPFAKNGIAYTQMLGDGGNDVLIETMLMHVSGEWLKSAFRIPAPKHDPQGYGSAVTYGRRYALAAAAGLAQVDDDGEAARVAGPLPAPITAAAAAHAEFDKLPDDAKSIVREAAMEIISLVREGNMTEVMRIIADGYHVAEDKLSLWSQLPSDVRAAIKRYQTKETDNAS